MTYIKVEGHPNLQRDTTSGAIINSNPSEYADYMKSYHLRQNQYQRLDKVEEEISEIKSLLLKIMDKL